MKPIVLFRTELAFQYELRIVKQYFEVIEQRCACPRDRLVIGRYSVLPFYQELQLDMELMGSRLVNNSGQHRWIANFDYYQDLKEYTAESWDDSNIHTCQHPGPFVVKGRLSSLKHRWSSHMFAKTKRKAIEIGKELTNDAAIREQGVIYRKYIPLVTYEVGLHDLRYTNEWRIFYLDETRLSHGYYWSLAENVTERNLPQAGLDFADRVATIACQHVRFFTVDIAEKEEGGWILIEVNDGQTSALSENDAHVLYKNLGQALGG